MEFQKYKNLKKGDWIFTCSMQPKQFSHINIDKNRNDYDPMSDENWEEIKYDDFETIEGSHHSFKHCGCNKISEKYAKWFIEHKIWELLDSFIASSEEAKWHFYEGCVKTKCRNHGIEYEGI